jgi:hypothetical protein
MMRGLYLQVFVIGGASNTDVRTRVGPKPDKRNDTRIKMKNVLERTATYGLALKDQSQGCDSSCSRSHASDGACLVCGKPYGPHSGHSCQDGKRGSWSTGGGVRVIKNGQELIVSGGTPSSCAYLGVAAWDAITGEVTLEFTTVEEFV